MYNLIVGVLAVSLMIGVAVAGLTYLGPAFTNSSTKVVAAELVNSAEQIQGAEALYKLDNGGAYSVDSATPGSGVTALEPSYLSSTPAVPASLSAGPWVITGGTDANSNPTAVLSLALTGSDAAVLAVQAEMAKEVGTYGGTGTAPYGISGAAGAYSFSFNL